MAWCSIPPFLPRLVDDDKLCLRPGNGRVNECAAQHACVGPEKQKDDRAADLQPLGLVYGDGPGMGEHLQIGAGDLNLLVVEAHPQGRPRGRDDLPDRPVRHNKPLLVVKVLGCCGRSYGRR